MKTVSQTRLLFPRQIGLILLASAFAIPTFAQEEGQTANPQSTPPAAVDQQPSPMAQQPQAVPGTLKEPQEGFWGRLNPFARKKWVNKRVDPLRDQLGELDEVNAKNAHDIQDMDSRAQAGIRQAQSSADAANQTASAADSQARNAGSIAQGASTRVDRLKTTVSGLDQYRQATEVEVKFHGNQPILSAKAKGDLDEFAANLTGQQGYILEIEGYSPMPGGAGIQSSGRLAEAVKRYLVEEHEIPIYRLHSVALGNSPAAGEEETRPARVGTVHIRLMENSLAAQEAAPPHGDASSTGAERP